MIEDVHKVLLKVVLPPECIDDCGMRVSFGDFAVLECIEDLVNDTRLLRLQAKPLLGCVSESERFVEIGSFATHIHFM
jgi:hypothetical protein